MLYVDVYGTLCYPPDAPMETLVEGWMKPKEEQIWKRKELPGFFNRIEFDDDGNAILTAEQERYAATEVRRCKEGYWLFINNKLTYLTGKNYFYLQWWTLEDDINPEYRDTDRRYFMFLDHWEKVLWCLGIFRGKKRREGASSQATSNLVYECIFYTNSNCGLVSKTNIDSRDTFTDMVRHGYNRLPIFLKPRQLNRADSVTELVFAAKIVKGETDDGGLRSKINYRAPVLNAYDRGRMSRILADEGGKWPPEVDFAKFISIVSKTMVKGAKRVGFCEAPSTVNEMTKGGGAAYKKAWDGANQFKFLHRPTPNRFVTYFSAAYDGYEGFIDYYGDSVIGEPTLEQYQYLVEKWVRKDPITGDVISELTEEDIKMGAKAYVLGRRIGLTGDLLEEEIRMNPCTVQEMFEAANTDCAFNSYNIHQQIKYLEENPIKLRRVSFYRNLDQSVGWRDDERGYWRVLAFPAKGEDNKHKYETLVKKPGRIDDGIISVDSYSNSQGGRRYGSKAGAYIIRKFNLLDPENTGLPVAEFWGRPAEKGVLHEQILLACEFYGYQSSWEHVADDYFSYFRERGRLGYLMRYPLSSIDPVKRENAERHFGYPTTPFALTKALDAGIAYVNNHCNKIYFPELLNQMLTFDPYDRTKSDLVVAFINGLVCAMETVNLPKKIKEPLIPVYENPQYRQN